MNAAIKNKPATDISVTGFYAQLTGN